MQGLDINSAKILHYERTDNPKTLKYTYFDTQTGLKDYFYSHQKVNHISNLPGTLFLTLDGNQQDKYFLGFSHRIHELWQKEPIKFEEPLEKEIKKIENKEKKTITKLVPWQIRKLREKGFSWQEVREFCGVSEWTIRRWKKEENSKSRKKPGRKPKINGNNLALLESCINAFKEQPQQWIADYLSRETGQKISQPTVCRLYKKYGITRKTFTYSYSEQIPYLENIKLFTDEIKLLPATQLIAEDECAFYLNEAPRRGYGWKGERVISSKPGNFKARYTLMLCIRNVESKGVIHWKLIEKGAKAKDFHDFIKEINLPSGEKYYLMMDNVRVHKAVKSCQKESRLPIRELLTQMNMEPKYLVPYTPQLNPVELCFCFLRNYVEKHKPRTFEQLKYIIKQGVMELQKKDMTKYFRHCMNYGFKTSNKIE